MWVLYCIFQKYNASLVTDHEVFISIERAIIIDPSESTFQRKRIESLCQFLDALLFNLNHITLMKRMGWPFI